MLPSIIMSGVGDRRKGGPPVSRVSSIEDFPPSHSAGGSLEGGFALQKGHLISR